MRLEIGGGKGITQEQFVSLRDALVVWSKRHYNWEIDDINFLGDSGFGVSLSGNIPINNGMVETLEQVFLDHHLGLGTNPEQVAMLLFPN